MAETFERDAAEFRGHVVRYIQHRDCYLGAWQWATAEEHDCPAARAAVDDVVAVPLVPTVAAVRAADEEWDAGDMACGDLVLELRHRVRALVPGQVLRVIARDSGAPQDLPAWCGMTGHRLVAARHPEYCIERRLVDRGRNPV